MSKANKTQELFEVVQFYEEKLQRALDDETPDIQACMIEARENLVNAMISDRIGKTRTWTVNYPPAHFPYDPRDAYEATVVVSESDQELIVQNVLIKFDEDDVLPSLDIVLLHVETALDDHIDDHEKSARDNYENMMYESAAGK